MKVVYYLARFLQGLGLLLLPSAIWVAEFEKSEAGAIGIFIGSVVIFSVGSLVMSLLARRS